MPCATCARQYARRTDGQTHRHTDGRTDGRTDIQNSRTDRQTGKAGRPGRPMMQCKAQRLMQRCSAWCSTLCGTCRSAVPSGRGLVYPSARHRGGLDLLRGAVAADPRRRTEPQPAPPAPRRPHPCLPRHGHVRHYRRPLSTARDPVAAGPRPVGHQHGQCPHLPAGRARGAVGLGLRQAAAVRRHARRAGVRRARPAAADDEGSAPREGAPGKASLHSTAPAGEGGGVLGPPPIGPPPPINDRGKILSGPFGQRKIFAGPFGAGPFRANLFFGGANADQDTWSNKAFVWKRQRSPPRPAPTRPHCSAHISAARTEAHARHGDLHCRRRQEPCSTDGLHKMFGRGPETLKIAVLPTNAPGSPGARPRAPGNKYEGEETAGDMGGGVRNPKRRGPKMAQVNVSCNQSGPLPPKPRVQGEGGGPSSGRQPF